MCGNDQGKRYKGWFSYALRYLLGIVLVGGGLSVSAGPIDADNFADPAMDARYQALIADLRCLVCQNQNIAGSNADLAKDLRRQVREMMRAGNRDAEIVQFMVDRYGDFVLYNPPLKISTLLLWIGPFLLLATGLIIVVVMVRRRRQAPAVHLSTTDRETARHLLRDDGEAEK